MASTRGPRGWTKRVKGALLNVLSLGRVVTSVLEAEDALSDDPETRSRAAHGQLQREVALLRQELRLKDERMERVPACCPPRPDVTFVSSTRHDTRRGPGGGALGSFYRGRVALAVPNGIIRA